jgi:hypothetical protein
LCASAGGVMVAALGIYSLGNKKQQGPIQQTITFDENYFGGKLFAECMKIHGVKYVLRQIRKNQFLDSYLLSLVDIFLQF